MTALLVTGMSGTGKSSVLRELARRGHHVVDTDTDEWSRWTVDADGAPDWVWDEERVGALLREPRDGLLVVAGCRTNQGAFYDLFDAVVVLVAPADVVLERIRTRVGNDYGKSVQDRLRVLHDLAVTEPRLVATATVVLDASRPLSVVADEVEAVATALGR